MLIKMYTIIIFIISYHGLAVANNGCTPGNFNDIEQNICKSCPIGHYQDEYAKIVCKQCHTGMYAFQPGGATCLNCRGGSYSNERGKTQCDVCPGGYYQPNVGRSKCKRCQGVRVSNPGAIKCSNRQLCSRGTFANTTSRACELCPYGKYSTKSGQSECKPCPGNKVSNLGSTSASSCYACSAGKYSDDGECQSCSPNYSFLDSDTCLNECPPGSYKSNNGCYLCSSGKYQDQSGESICKDCPHGKMSVLTNQTSVTACLPCQAGRFSTASGICSECPAGQYQDQVGTNTCKNCTMGKYQDTHGSTNCKACGLGKVIAEPGQVSCKDCAIGYYEDGFEQTECKECPQGKYGILAGHFKCTWCPRGKYQNEKGQNTCKNCPAGTYGFNFGNVLNTNVLSCTNCLAGKTSKAGALQCYDCPAGKYGENSECKDCANGKFSTSGASRCLDQTKCPYGKTISSNSNTCASCPVGTFQDNDWQDTTKTCKTCPVGFYSGVSGANACKTCPAGQSSNSLKSSCVQCDIGKYAFKSECKVCPDGGEPFPPHSNNVGGSEGEAETCKYNETISKIHEDSGSYDVRENHYIDTTVQKVKACPLGKWTRDKIGRLTACASCPEGKFGKERKVDWKRTNIFWSWTSYRNYENHIPKITNTCIDCPAGWYQNLVGQTSCVKASKNNIVPYTGLAKQTPCYIEDSDKYWQTSGTGSTSCHSVFTCPRGTARNDWRQVLVNEGQSMSLDGATCRVCMPACYEMYKIGEAAADSADKKEDYGRAYCTYNPQCMMSNGICTEKANYWCPPGPLVLSKSEGGGENYKLDGYYDDTYDYYGYKLREEPRNFQDYTWLTGQYNPVVAYAPVGTIGGCIDCPFGRTSTGGDIGASTCIKCPNGKFNDGKFPFTECKHCPDGKIAAPEWQDVRYGDMTNNDPLIRYCPASTGAVSGDDAREALWGYQKKITFGARCVSCPIGKFENKKDCDWCPHGSYSDEIGQSECKTCPGGWKSVRHPSPGCSECPAGSYSEPSIQVNRITQWSSKWAKLDTAAATNYENKRWLHQVANAQFCNHCGEEEYTDIGCAQWSGINQMWWSTETRGISCNGYRDVISNSGNSVCTLCPVGKYQSVAGASQCAECPNGRYVNNLALEGATKEEDVCDDCPACLPDEMTIGTSINGQCHLCCPVCPAGTYIGPIIDGECPTCLPCTSGTYQTQIGQASCTSCAPGKISNTRGSTTNTCKDCPRGSATYDKTTTCTKCPAAKYADEPGLNICKECPAGKYNDDFVGITWDCFKCPKGKYQDKTGQRTCNTCEYGTFQQNEGQVECIDCAASTPSTNTVGTSDPDDCVSCPPGRFEDDKSELIGRCIKCPLGKFGQGCQEECAPGYEMFTLGAKTNDTCTECPPGKASPAGQPMCVFCNIGKYQDEKGQATCKECAEKFAPYIGSVSEEDCIGSCQVGFEMKSGKCSICAAGKYYSIDGYVCQDCPRGQYQSNEAQVSCVQCEPGKYENQEGQATCKRCAPINGDQYQNEYGQTWCKYCAIDYKLDMDTSFDIVIRGHLSISHDKLCIKCDNGKTADQYDTNCVMCAAGKFNSDDTEGCQTCPTGWTNNTQHTQCLPMYARGSICPPLGCDICQNGEYLTMGGCKQCPAGKYSDDTADVQCKSCAAGKYQNQTGQESCTDCPAGQFQPNMGQTSCPLCRQHHYQNLEGQNECNECPSGWQRNSFQLPRTTCVKCGDAPMYSNYTVDGYNCRKPTATVCSASQQNAFPFEESCHQCRKTTFFNTTTKKCEACPLGKTTYSNGLQICETCRLGQRPTTGGVCQYCEAGRYQDSYFQSECKECPVGKSLSTTGSRNPNDCTLCAIGRYQDQTGQAGCKDCTEGRWATHGAEKCNACTEEEDKAGQCVKCQRGKQKSVDRRSTWIEGGWTSNIDASLTWTSVKYDYTTKQCADFDWPVATPRKRIWNSFWSAKSSRTEQTLDKREWNPETKGVWMDYATATAQTLLNGDTWGLGTTYENVAGYGRQKGGYAFDLGTFKDIDDNPLTGLSVFAYNRAFWYIQKLGADTESDYDDSYLIYPNWQSNPQLVPGKSTTGSCNKDIFQWANAQYEWIPYADNAYDYNTDSSNVPYWNGQQCVGRNTKSGDFVYLRSSIRNDPAVSGCNPVTCKYFSKDSTYGYFTYETFELCDASKPAGNPNTCSQSWNGCPPPLAEGCWQYWGKTGETVVPAYDWFQNTSVSGQPINGMTHVCGDPSTLPQANYSMQLGTDTVTPRNNNIVGIDGDWSREYVWANTKDVPDAAHCGVCLSVTKGDFTAIEPDGFANGYAYPKDGRVFTDIQVANLVDEVGTLTQAQCENPTGCQRVEYYLGACAAGESITNAAACKMAARRFTDFGFDAVSADRLQDLDNNDLLDNDGFRDFTFTVEGYSTSEHGGGWVPTKTYSSGSNPSKLSTPNCRLGSTINSWTEYHNGPWHTVHEKTPPVFFQSESFENMYGCTDNGKGACICRRVLENLTSYTKTQCETPDDVVYCDSGPQKDALYDANTCGTCADSTPYDANGDGIISKDECGDCPEAEDSELLATPQPTNPECWGYENKWSDSTNFYIYSGLCGDSRGSINSEYNCVCECLDNTCTAASGIGRRRVKHPLGTRNIICNDVCAKPVKIKLNQSQCEINVTTPGKYVTQGAMVESTKAKTCWTMIKSGDTNWYSCTTNIIYNGGTCYCECKTSGTNCASNQRRQVPFENGYYYAQGYKTCDAICANTDGTKVCNTQFPWLTGPEDMSEAECNSLNYIRQDIPDADPPVNALRFFTNVSFNDTDISFVETYYEDNPLSEIIVGGGFLKDIAFMDMVGDDVKEMLLHDGSFRYFKWETDRWAESLNVDFMIDGKSRFNVVSDGGGHGGAGFEVFDFDNDGDDDIFIKDINKLYLNNGTLSDGTRNFDITDNPFGSSYGLSVFNDVAISVVGGGYFKYIREGTTFIPHQRLAIRFNDVTLKGSGPNVLKLFGGGDDSNSTKTEETTQNYRYFYFGNNYYVGHDFTNAPEVLNVTFGFGTGTPLTFNWDCSTTWGCENGRNGAGHNFFTTGWQPGRQYGDTGGSTCDGNNPTPTTCDWLPWRIMIDPSDDTWKITLDDSDVNALNLFGGKADNSGLFFMPYDFTNIPETLVIHMAGNNKTIQIDWDCTTIDKCVEGFVNKNHDVYKTGSGRISSLEGGGVGGNFMLHDANQDGNADFFKVSGDRVYMYLGNSGGGFDAAIEITDKFAKTGLKLSTISTYLDGSIVMGDEQGNLNSCSGSCSNTSTLPDVSWVESTTYFTDGTTLRGLSYEQTFSYRRYSDEILYDQAKTWLQYTKKEYAEQGYTVSAVFGMGTPTGGYSVMGTPTGCDNCRCGTLTYNIISTINNDGSWDHQYDSNNAFARKAVYFDDRSEAECGKVLASPSWSTGYCQGATWRTKEQCVTNLNVSAFTYGQCRHYCPTGVTLEKCGSCAQHGDSESSCGSCYDINIVDILSQTSPVTCYNSAYYVTCQNCAVGKYRQDFCFDATIGAVDATIGAENECYDSCTGDISARLVTEESQCTSSCSVNEYNPIVFKKNGKCDDWTYSLTGTQDSDSGGLSVVWNTPELCANRCRELNSLTTSFWMFDDRCGCSGTTSGVCPSTPCGTDCTVATGCCGGANSSKYKVYEIETSVRNETQCVSSCSDSSKNESQCVSSCSTALNPRINVDDEYVCEDLSGRSEADCVLDKSFYESERCEDNSGRSQEDCEMDKSNWVLHKTVCLTWTERTWLTPMWTNRTWTNRTWTDGSCQSCGRGKYATAPSATHCSPCLFNEYQDQYTNTQYSCKTCPEGYINVANRTFCEKCPAGRYDTTQKACLACEPGKYDDDLDSTTDCLSCGVGSYTDGVTCQTCPTGKYDDDGDSSTACKSCGAGSFINGSTCQTCPTGKYDDDGDSSTACKSCGAGSFINGSTCQTCPTGKYDDDGDPSSACKSCEKGTYSDGPAAISCKTCGAGSYTGRKTGATFCKTCEAGKYSVNSWVVTCYTCEPGFITGTTGDGAIACTRCSSGYYSDVSNLTLCKSCPAGSETKKEIEADDCTLCKAGKYSSIQSVTCNYTDAGYYAAETNGTAQTPCASGTYQPNIGQTVCLTAEAGHYVAETSGTAQTPCASGTYQPNIGQTVCLTADAGHYVAETGSAAQTPASAGYYVAGTGAIEQTLCAPRTYSNGQGAVSCQECSAGYITGVIGTGATSCTGCTSGTFSSESNSTECQQCPEGSISEDLARECVGVSMYYDNSDYERCSGDKISVNLEGGTHNIVEVSKDDYISCDSSNGELKSVQQSGGAIELDSLAAPPGYTRYFICSLPGHCLAGKKFRTSCVIKTYGVVIAKNPATSQCEKQCAKWKNELAPGFEDGSLDIELTGDNCDEMSANVNPLISDAC